MQLRNNHLDIEGVKAACSGRWADVLAAVGGIDPAILDGQHHACPKCGGNDRFRFIDDATGAVLCNQCFHAKNGDGIAAIQWATDQPFNVALRMIAAHVGVEPVRNGHNGHSDADIVERIARQKRVPIDSWKAFGASLAKRGKLTVCRLPQYDERGQHSNDFDISDIDAKWSKGLGQKGKRAGIFLADAKPPAAGETVLVTEGAKDAAALHSLGYQAVGIPTSTMAVKFARLFGGCNVVIVPDRDTAGEDGAQKTAARLAGVASSVRIATLPGELRESCGDDVRDVLSRKGGEDLLRQAIDDAREWEPSEGDETSGGDAPAIADDFDKEDVGQTDPGIIARGFLASEMTADGVCRLRHWRGECWRWSNGRYSTLSDDALTSQLWKFTDRSFTKITRSFISNAKMAVASLAMLDERREQPSWLTDSPPFPADEILATSSALIHLPSLADGTGNHTVAPTPRFFSSVGCGVQFDPDAADPVEWRKFLASVWPDDPQQINALQEWFGYTLTANTRQQKMLLLIGPKRSGKGTIARVQRELIGPDNVAGPTLAGLATNFGLWPLIGKSLAIIADARLSGRTDRAIVTERLLSISGEDCQTIDRKCLQPITCTLPTRLMLMTNEVPKLDDASGALASRFIVLQMKRSFYGAEDHGLTDRLLEELPGILLWAIEGWKRLRDRGYFLQPDSSAGVVEDMAYVTSPISKFVADWCIVDPAAEITVARLFEQWCEWCESEKRKPGDQATFGRDIFAALPDLTKTRPRIGGKRVWKYSGIRLRTEADDLDEMEREYVHSTAGGPGGPRTNGEHAIGGGHTHTHVPGGGRNTEMPGPPGPPGPDTCPDCGFERTAECAAGGCRV